MFLFINLVSPFLCSKLRAEKDREVSNLKRDQSRKEYEIKKLEATNQKQAAVIQRKTEQLQAVQAKAKTASDLAQYAAAKREERDAERAKKIEAMKAQRVPIAAQPPKPPTPASGGEKAIAPAKPKDASTSETGVCVRCVSLGVIFQLIALRAVQLLQWRRMGKFPA